MAEETPTEPEVPASIQKMIRAFIEIMIREIRKEDNKQYIRNHVVHPLLLILYTEIHPYMQALIWVIASICIISIAILVMLIVFYLKR